MMMIEDRAFAELVKTIANLAVSAQETADEDAGEHKPLAALRGYQHADNYEAILHRIANAVGVQKQELLPGVERWEAACEATINREGYDMFDLTLGNAKLPELMDSLQDR